MGLRHGLLAALAVCILAAAGVVACGGAGQPAPQTESPVLAPSPEPTQSPAKTRRRGDEKLAPELKGISGWINSEPLTLESQLGNVVLIDFWTYTCVNCIRTFPYLKAWHEKYADKGLVIVGVHTPEFAFEKVRENVVNAVNTFGLKYAIAQDNDYGTWNAFGNNAWPSKYLIDKDGYIRFSHFGEGQYDETEQKIRELLEEAGANLDGISSTTDAPPPVAVGAFGGRSNNSLTRELYAGYERNYGALLFGATPAYVLHGEYFKKQDAAVLYTDPGKHENHFIYLNGLWLNKAQSLVHVRQAENHEDYIAIKFFATSVNAVMASEGSEPYEVRITMDSVPLKPDQAGADVAFDDDGNSYVRVDEPRMYRVVRISKFGGHELRLSANSPGMALFAFTFGAYEDGP